MLLGQCYVVLPNSQQYMIRLGNYLWPINFKAIDKGVLMSREY